MKALVIYHNNIPSSIDRISGIVWDITDSLKANYGLLDDCTLFDLKVILNEVLLNAIKHGNKGDENKQVKIRAGISENNFVFIIIEDEGAGFDYGCHCKNRKAVDEESDICSIMESGRGILIVSCLCDSFRINSKGNKIVILKKLA